MVFAACRLPCIATSATPGRLFRVTMSPTAKTSGRPGSVRSGSVAIRPARSVSAPDASASMAARGDACTPAAQMTMCAAIRSVPSLVCTSTPCTSMPVTREPIRSSTPSFSSASRGAGREVVAEGRERFLAPVHQQDAHRGRIEGPEVVAETAHRELSDLPGDLDAGRSGADHDDREPVLALGRVARGLGHFERAEDPAAELERVVEGLHPRRKERELVVTEVRLPDAAGHDETVVGHLDGRVQGTLREHDPAVEVEARHLGELDPDVLVPVQGLRSGTAIWPSERMPGRDVVQQRLEQVVVAPVEEGDVDILVSFPEVPTRGQPAEAATDDDDAMLRLRLR